MELKPIRKNITLKDQAYEQIRQAINTNTLKPGTALTEEQLSSMLSISRTPIRSALQQLVYEKLLSQDGTGISMYLPLRKKVCRIPRKSALYWNVWLLIPPFSHYRRQSFRSWNGLTGNNMN